MLFRKKIDTVQSDAEEFANFTVVWMPAVFSSFLPLSIPAILQFVQVRVLLVGDLPQLHSLVGQLLLRVRVPRHQVLLHLLLLLRGLQHRRLLLQLRDGVLQVRGQLLVLWGLQIEQDLKIQENIIGRKLDIIRIKRPPTVLKEIFMHQENIWTRCLSH